VGQTLLPVKLLFSSGEDEFVTALDALENLILTRSHIANGDLLEGSE